MTFVHSTRAQLIARVRARYQAATGLDAVKGAAFLAACSDAELRAAFGATQGQVASLKGRLTAQAAKADAVRQAAGE